MARNGDRRSWLALQKRIRMMRIPSTGEDPEALLTEQNEPIATEDGQDIVHEGG